MSVITFSGLATGLDTANLITQLVYAERAPARRMETEQTTLKSKGNKLTSLRSKLDELKAAAEALNARGDVLTSKAVSANENVVKASGEGGASLGRFDVRVTQLARAARTYSDGVSSRSEVGLFGTGTITLQMGAGDAKTIDVSATDTLDSVAAKVNASGAGITAGVLFDGTSYRLQLSGSLTGAANALALTESGTTLGLATPANQVQTALDAQFTVDGFTMTRSSNTVVDAVPGVTLELRGVSSGTDPTVVEVSRDGAALKERVQKLVDAYNTVNTFVNAESAFVGVKKGPESLTGDSTVRSVQARLRSVIGGVVAGTTGKYTTLASLGITAAGNGALTLDATKLDRALSDDAEAVSALFAKDAAGAALSLVDVVKSFTDPREGLLSQRITNVDARQRALQTQIDRFQLRLDKYEEGLRRQFATLESTVNNIQSQGSQITAALGALS